MLTVASAIDAQAFDTAASLPVNGLDVIEDSICLGNFFCGLALTTERKR